MRSHTVLALALTALMPIAFAEEGAAAPLPRVLIIGDSISIGYTPPLTELLKGKAEVTHNEGNAQHTGVGVKSLDQWLGDTHWDVIHFNFGLHDLKYVNDEGKNATSAAEGHIQVPLDKYRENLETIVQRLKKTGAKLIFATTTPVPEELASPPRKPEDVVKYNEAALEVMKKNGIAIDDLYAYALPKLKDWQRPHNVHFTEAGSKALAGQVAKSILETLGMPLNVPEAGKG